MDKSSFENIEKIIGKSYSNIGIEVIFCKFS